MVQKGSVRLSSDGGFGVKSRNRTGMFICIKKPGHPRLPGRGGLRNQDKDSHISELVSVNGLTGAKRWWER